MTVGSNPGEQSLEVAKILYNPPGPIATIYSSMDMSSDQSRNLGILKRK